MADETEKLPTCDAVFVIDRATNKVLSEWSDALEVRTFAENLGRVKRARGGQNWGFFLTAVLDEIRAEGFVLTKSGSAGGVDGDVVEGQGDVSAEPLAEPGRS